MGSRGRGAQGSEATPALPRELRIDSRLELVPAVGDAVHEVCAALGMPDEAGYQVRTCVVEAVNNAIIHAYGGAPSGSVTVRLALADGALVIEVLDRGRAMSALPPVVAPADAEDLDCLAVAGRGWMIMRAWMDSATYESGGCENTVRLVKRLGGRATLAGR